MGAPPVNNTFSLLTRLLPATLEVEQQHEAERLREATQAEEMRFQEELKRRQARPRSLFPQTSHVVPDLVLHQQAQLRNLGDVETLNLPLIRTNRTR